MPFWIVRNDITRMRVDAIVTAANAALQGGGGVDGVIRAAAGPELQEACRALGGCPAGQVRLTPGFRLPCRWVIHAVGPVWEGGQKGEREKLASCYRRALELAEALGCESLAFPLISSGTYGYPKQEAVRVAREAIEVFLRKSEMTVYLVVYGQESLEASRSVFSEIREYIDSRYVQEHPARRGQNARRLESARRERERREEECGFYQPDVFPDGDACASVPAPAAPAAPPPPVLAQAPGKPKDKGAWGVRPPEGKDWRFGELDESFQQMLLRLIDQRGMTDAACYKRANIDRKLFSKIRNDVHYKPSKPTAVAFAVALELDLEQTRELLGKAGFALSRSSRFDLIVQYFIEKGRYDVFEINEALFEFDQALLGNVS